MLRYKTETIPGLVALYDIRPGNGAGQFLQPRSPHGHKITLYRFNQGGGSYYCRGLKSEQGAEPPGSLTLTIEYNQPREANQSAPAILQFQRIEIRGIRSLLVFTHAEIMFHVCLATSHVALLLARTQAMA